jgi:uracil-DNA glycosylase
VAEVSRHGRQVRRVIFVGSNPAINANTTQPFQSSRSGLILRAWVAQMGLRFEDCGLANTSDTPTPHNRPLSRRELVEGIPALREKVQGYDIVVALGTTADAALTLAGIAHETLPHPSGLNRKCNNKGWLAGELERVRWAISSG